MLYPKFKYLHLGFSFIGPKQGHFEKYNKKTLYPMLLKCYYHLHPLLENAIVDQGVDEDCNELEIFETTVNTNEPTKEFVNKELLIFKRFQMVAKCPFQ